MYKRQGQLSDRRQELEPGAILYEAQVSIDRLFGVLSGTLRGKSRLQSGDRPLIQTYGPGTLLGTGGLIEAGRYGAQVVASSRATVLVLPLPELQAAAETHPEGVTALHGLAVGALAARLEATQRRMLTLYHAGRQAGQAEAVDQLARPVLDLLLEGIPRADGALFWLMNDGRGELELQSIALARVRSEALARIESGLARAQHPLSIGDALVQQLERSEGYLELEAPPARSSLREWLNGAPRLIVAPLRARAHLDGMLILVTGREGVRFLPEDLDLLGAVAVQIEGAVERLKRIQERTDWGGLEPGR